MNLKRTLIERLPPEAKRLLAVPYDWYQTRQADAEFARKELPDATPADDAPQHIVCVVVDALRADHVNEEVTPFLATLSGTDAITPGTWTFPAMSSFVSGVYPHEHGAIRQSDEPDDADGFTLPPRMDGDRVTLTETLGGAGYETYGGFGHDTPFVALSGRFQTHALYHTVNANADDVLGAHREWIDGRDRTFSLLHLADPHVPVDPPEAYWNTYDVDPSIDGLENWRYDSEVDCGAECRRYREHRRRLYRAAVDYVDDALSRYVETLDAVLDDYLLVVTGDHGEALWEHVEFDVEHFSGTGCVGHGGAPYEQLSRVPLLTNREWNVDGDVSLIDVAPTILDSVGVEGPSMSGVSLLDGVPEGRYVFVEGNLDGTEKKAVYDDEYKLIVSPGADIGFRLPSERIATIPDERRRSMLEAVPQWPDGADGRTEVSGVVADRLAKLGYR